MSATKEGDKQSKVQRAIGAHVSISGSIDLAVDRAIDIGCVGVFQIFTCSPRKWNAKDLNSTEVELFREKARNGHFSSFAHMPYLPNLASADNELYIQSSKVLIRELGRCEQLGIRFLVIHLGSYAGTTLQDGERRLVSACKKALSATRNYDVRVLLESTAGARNSLGSQFESLRDLLAGIGDRERTGLCLDTCHLFASGYDIRSSEAAQSTMERFRDIVGPESLFLIHVNDSKGEKGEAKDRHEHIGLGRIGDEGFRSLFALAQVRNVPLILETPRDSTRDEREDLSHTKNLL
jgi:deoxyribonuclease IV